MASAMRCSGSRAKPSTRAGGPPRRRDPSTHATLGGGLDDGVLVMAGGQLDIQLDPGRHAARRRRRHPRAEAAIGPRRGNRWMGRAWVADDGRIGRFADMLVDSAKERRNADGAARTDQQLSIPCSLPTSWTTSPEHPETWRRPRSRRAVPWAPDGGVVRHSRDEHPRRPLVRQAHAPTRCRIGAMAGSRSAGSQGRVCQLTEIRATW
jgi:hypothetical protein